jgi:hypothetical protein
LYIARTYLSLFGKTPKQELIDHIIRLG